MTQREAIKKFIDGLPASFPKDDRAAFREAWSGYIDMLHRDGQITDKQAHNWEGPARYPQRRGRC